MKRHLLLLTLVIAALSIGLAGCGGSDSTTTMTNSATTEAAASTEAATTDTSIMTTGSAVCDEATITKAVKEAEPDVIKMDGVKCADGWAVAYPINSEYEFTMVFEAEGDTWINRSGVDCTTIPKELQAACETN